MRLQEGKGWGAGKKDGKQNKQVVKGWQTDG